MVLNPARTFLIDERKAEASALSSERAFLLVRPSQDRYCVKFILKERLFMKKLFLLLLVFIFTSSFTPLYEVILLGQSKVKREVPVKGTTGVPIFRSPNYSPVYICIYGNVLSIDWKKSIGTVFVQILNLDTNEFVLSDDYDAVTGETVEVFIKNAGRYQIMITSELYSGYGDFFVNE